MASGNGNEDMILTHTVTADNHTLPDAHDQAMLVQQVPVFSLPRMKLTADMQRTFFGCMRLPQFQEKYDNKKFLKKAYLNP